MESSGGAEQKLLENGTSSQSSSPRRKGGLRTMPFIIGTSHSLTHSLVINDVVLLALIEE